jgi:hypothetical protein
MLSPQAVERSQDMTRRSAWVLSAAIVATMVALVLFIASNTNQLGFDGDDGVLGAVLLKGWF